MIIVYLMHSDFKHCHGFQTQDSSCWYSKGPGTQGTRRDHQSGGISRPLSALPVDDFQLADGKGLGPSAMLGPWRCLTEGRFRCLEGDKTYRVQVGDFEILIVLKCFEALGPSSFTMMLWCFVFKEHVVEERWAIPQKALLLASPNVWKGQLSGSCMVGHQKTKGRKISRWIGLYTLLTLPYMLLQEDTTKLTKTMGHMKHMLVGQKKAPETPIGKRKNRVGPSKTGVFLKGRAFLIDQYE